jgi:hypothetical protein
MISVVGTSWIAKQKYGTQLKKVSGAFENVRELYSQVKEKQIIQNPMKNFGRFDQVSKNTCLAISLALFDAGASSVEDGMQNVGIVSTNEKGCLQSNKRYFTDYVDSGRKLSRGNFFIYTLPSTPIAEAAIHFGCQGPVAYFAFQNNQTNEALEQGRMMIETKETTDLLIVNANEEEAVCFYIKEQSNKQAGEHVSLEKVQQLLKDTEGLSEVINKISKEERE